MVKVLYPFTLDDLFDFAKETFPAFTTKSKLREHVYYRQTASYLADKAGYKLSRIADKLDVTHPSVIWAKDNAESKLLSNDDKFTKCYTDFVNKFNDHLVKKYSDELFKKFDSSELLNT